MPLPASDPSVARLFEQNLVTADDLDAATAAFLKRREEPGPIPLGERYRIDVAAAIDAHPPSAAIMANTETSPGLLRTMVRTAIILGTAERA